MTRWKIIEGKWVTGEDWFTVVDSHHEHNSYETGSKEIAEQFKKMMEDFE